jgi:hypothetical protein
MQDSDKLLQDYGEPVHQHTVIDGMGEFTIKHAYLVGKHNVQFISIKEFYNPYNSWDKHYAVVKARRVWRELRYNIKTK